MSDFLTRARNKVERRWDRYMEKAAEPATDEVSFKTGWMACARWAADLDPSDAEVEAAFEAFDDGVRLYDNMRAALIAARDVRRGADR